MRYIIAAMKRIELLAPAKTAEIGRQAILHGADAVYIGGPAFGARDKAANDMRDIAALVEFAQRFRARIYVTLNTILADAELEPARQVVQQCWDAGVDALIVQDMGLLELDLPPIDLHASTQCDIRTPEKARFLADCGFSQLVLARELSLKEITAVRAALPVDVIVEHFIHGALCVAFSGQCYISHAQTGRSANRGDCSQACRLPYTLQDNQGRVVAFEKHLLSLKDNNQSANLLPLIEAGVQSFKIEGRYKDAGYVKNITGHYRQLLDAIFEQHPELAPTSSGKVTLKFAPNPDKTFHRGATDYFTHGRSANPEHIAAFETPPSSVSQLAKSPMYQPRVSSSPRRKILRMAMVSPGCTSVRPSARRPTASSVSTPATGASGRMIRLTSSPACAPGFTSTAIVIRLGSRR